MSWFVMWGDNKQKSSAVNVSVSIIILLFAEVTSQAQIGTCFEPQYLASYAIFKKKYKPVVQ